LYVANVGESRVLLCKTDTDDVLRVIQPTVDHNLTNLDEVMRLTNLGLKIADGKINGWIIKMISKNMLKIKKLFR